MSYFLGFDCATKTFAFSLSHIDLNQQPIKPIKAKLATVTEILKRAKTAPPEEAMSLINAVIPTINELSRQSQSITLIDGETVDLFPGRADDTIKTVERIKALSKYVNDRIKPGLIGLPNVKVIVEFQMGQNSNSKTIASALIALFADYNVAIVGPSLKNKVSITPEGRYGNFTAKYATNYTANKAHAKYNFLEVEKIFGTNIPKTSPISLRGHIADSFMQVLGYLMYASDDMQF